MKIKVIQAFVETPKGRCVCFIQQVTEKQVVVIVDEHTLQTFNRTDGTIKHSKTHCRIKMKKIEQFLDSQGLDKWHGGWKPKLCTEPLRTDPSINPDRASWFKRQGVEIIDCKSYV